MGPRHDRRQVSKMTFGEAKKEFLKGAANGFGNVVTSMATKMLLNSVAS